MSDFVQFPDQVYTQAGNVFATFVGAASGFTLPNARAMMWFAQLAYEVDTSGNNGTAAKIDRVRTLWEFEPVTTFRARAVSPVASFDTTGVFGERADAVVLSFAGTDPAVWETLATDFNPQIGPDNTHVGFQAAMNAVENDVRAAITLSQQRNKPLFITGHSLGGALAALAARFAVAQNHAPRAVYAYGMPRTGDATFQAAYNGALGNMTYRLVHGRDLVARVPPAAINYRHVGRVLQCDPAARFVAADLTAQPSNDPDVTFAYLQQIMTIPGAAGALAGLIAGGIGPQSLKTALGHLLQKPGHGPLGQWFKFIPPPIRDHLQDQYIGAL
ncbi:MAG: triacylglycerol lipase [Hyphomicrobiales bacterium]|jgi:hypothetical protein|nr:triacylglycerol lipase [Hyphomicrobiales bacterium]